MKIILEYLIYLFIIFMPLGLLFRYKIFQNAYIVPQDLVVTVIFLITIIFYLKNKIKPWARKFILFQVLFVLTGIVSLLINKIMYQDINFGTSILYPLRYVIYLNLILLGTLSINIRFIKNILMFMVFSVLLIGFIQFFFYNNLKNLFYLGWDDHLYRLFSTFLDPNFAGVYYVIIFIFLTYYVVYRSYLLSYKELIYAFFSLLAIYLTYSRSALVSLISAILTIGTIKKKFKIIIVCLFSMIVILLLVSDFGVEGLNPLRTASTVSRIKSVNEAAAVIMESKLIGVGFNAYRYALVRQGIRTEKGASMSNADAGTDNSYLFVIATSGILGFAFFTMSYIFLIVELKKEKLKINLFLIGIITAILVSGLFINTLFYTPILALVFLLVSFRKILE